MPRCGASRAEHNETCKICGDDACPQCDNGVGCNECYRKYYCCKEFSATHEGSIPGYSRTLGTKATFGVAMSARVYSVAAASIGTVAECSWVWEIHRDVPLQGRNCLVTFIYRASICVL